jgi:DNA-binding transcriptional ArsR family regulator
MSANPHLAEIAALVGDPARAAMLAALLDGRALTATELAHVAGVAPPTASGHRGKLAAAGLLSRASQGRHRYYRLAAPRVGAMLEAIMLVADAGPACCGPPWRVGAALRNARSCYDHLAGRLAVGLADALAAQGAIRLGDDGGEVTAAGLALFARLGVNVDSLGRRPFCRPCLDWSERRPHLAGVVGKALLDHALGQGWVARRADSRALDVTLAGRRGFAAAFGLAPEVYG